MKGLFFPIVLLFFTISANAQIYKKDSIRLASVYGEEIMKVAFDYNPNEEFSLGWQTKTDTSTNIYAQSFSPKGIPIGRKFKIASVPFKYNWRSDFDIAVDKGGNSIVVWSHVEKPTEYIVYYQVFNPQGTPFDEPQKLTIASKGSVNISKNAQDEFIISWFSGNEIKSQFFNKEKNKEGELINSWYVGALSPHTFPIELTDSSYLAIASFRTHTSASPSGSVTFVNKESEVLNYRELGLRSCCMAAFDMDYGEMKTVISFSLASFSNYHPDGTYLSFFSNFNGSQSDFHLDEEPSLLIQVSQNKQGKVFAGSKSKSGKVKVYYLENSGQQVYEPLEMWDDTGEKSIASIDVKLSNDDHGSIIYAVNGTEGNHIYLQKTLFKSNKQTEDIIVNTSFRQQAEYSKTLSTNNNHLVIWNNYKGENNAIFAQKYDSLFNKVLDVKLVEIKANTAIGNLEAAIDSAGNFMILWREENSPNIYAQKFDINGVPLTEKFTINQVLEYGVPRNSFFPKISANKRGDFVIIWYHGNSYLNARLIKADGFDSGEKSIEGCCRTVPDFNYLNDSKVSINDNGKIVIASRSGYYDLSIMVYNENFEVLSKSMNENRLGANGGLDININNNDQILLAWTFSSKTAVKRFDENGTEIGDEIVFTNVDGLRLPRLGVNYNGDFCVIFKKSNSRPIEIQKFKANGEKDGEIIRVNSFLTFHQPEVSYNSSKQIFATWGSSAYTKYGKDLLVKGFYDKSSIPFGSKIYHQNADLYSGDSIAFGGEFIKNGGRFSHTYKSNIDSTVLLTVNLIFKDAPTAPKSLTKTEGDKFIQLNWDESNNAFLKQYLIYRSTKSDKNTATLISRTNQPTYIDYNIAYSETYYYWVITEDISGKRSEFSKAVMGSPLNYPPAKPHPISANIRFGTLTLRWKANVEPDLVGYYIFWSSSDDFSTAIRIGHSYTKNFVDPGKLENGPRYYWLKVFDREGNESEISDVGFILINSIPEEITPPEETPAPEETLPPEEINFSFEFFPNPSYDAISIILNKPSNISEIMVVDLMGKSSNVNWKQTEDETIVSVASLPPGIYYLWVVTDSDKLGVKIIRN
ncbi:T9SS type A sorting domain-containing protein [uncultured Cyclobacterium sp.]|uniref:T9SS type A sorting domain-containing protein n=1 Tax=uncultured Cyclobacterium sp. TaxID=453820 RepID=UPI0030EE0D2A|tara:strand:+ start:11968 stop:15231 length:3264 start_codon:yes stop_codon:yes gene_type:complete